MSSPAWLPQELQSSCSGVSSQVSVSGSSIGGHNSDHLLPSTTPSTAVTPPTTKGPTGPPGDLTSVRANFVSTPGYVLPAPSFSYNVIPTAGTASGSSQQNSSRPVVASNPPPSAAKIQPPGPPLSGLSSPTGPSFSYNIISHANDSSSSVQHLPPSSATSSCHVQAGKITLPANTVSSQPPVPGLSDHSNSFVAGIAAQNMPPPIPAPVSIPKGVSSSSTSFSFSGIPPLRQKDPSLNSNSSGSASQEASTASPASSSSQSAPMPTHNSSSSSTTSLVAPNLYPATFWMPTVPSFHSPSGMPGPPGIAPALSMSSTLTVQSASLDSSSSNLVRPVLPSMAPVPPNPALQQKTHPSYPSLPAMAPPPQGIWLQAPQVVGLQRPPFIPFSGALPGPFPLPARGMPLPSVPLPDSQAPGVTPIATPPSSGASGHQLPSNSAVQSDLSPPGTENSKNASAIANKDGVAANNEQVDAWTAHKTDTGAVYYYNAVTGESTYEKPSGFRGEPDKVTDLLTTPVSWEKLAGTDWALVNTNDGKKYYYNTKTKVSSWQVPMEVIELRKKQEGDTPKEHTMSVPNASVLTEKGSATTSLSAPSVNTGGRDATALRPSGALGSSSALDLIKKKLQDCGAPTTSSPLPASLEPTMSDVNGSTAIEATAKGMQIENSKDKLNNANGDGNMSDSSSDSEDVDRPTKEECIIQFKEMLKERGVAPFSKWEKELPKIVYDPRFKAIPGYSARRSLFEHYVRTRAEEERKEKRAAQKAAIEGFRQLLEEASEDIDHRTDYHVFKKKWGNDPRFMALDRKERENLLNERVLPLKKAAEEKIQAIRAATASGFKSMLRDKRDITTSTRWSKVKDSLRNDPRYKSVKHEDREALFNEYISELKAAEEEVERAEKAKREEQEKLKEREREMRKRKVREEQEMERVRLKVRRKEAVSSYQALLVETIKDPQASWTESKLKLEKDPQGRATNADLDEADKEKLFREHVKSLYERCVREFRALLAEVITAEAASQVTDDGKTVLTSWSMAKQILKPDPRYSKMARNDRESLWRRYADGMQRKHKLVSDTTEEKHGLEVKSKSSLDSGRSPSVSRRNHGRR